MFANDASAGALLPLRLAHVAVRCPSLARQSITLAVSAARSGKDVRLYLRLCEVANHLGLPDVGAADQEWATKQEEANRRELSRLEGELRGYKNNLIRESIRMGQEDLATHHLLTGGPPPDPTNPSTNNAGYNAAYQAFGKMRDYCTTPTHMASMTLRLVYTLLLQSASAQGVGASAAMPLSSILANASRLRSVGVKEEEQNKLLPIGWAATGIAQLALGHYRDAATAFCAVSFDYHTLGPIHGTDFGRSVASAHDIAVYGGLCALATLDRTTLVNTILGGPFRAFLELEPHMRKAISLYTTAKYQACLSLLRHYYSDWSLDVFLGASIASVPGRSHVDRLLARIREKSITAYFSSFSEVSLASLATTFPPASSSPTVMEDEVLSMIQSGTLGARLDVVNGVLVAPRQEIRSSTHAAAQATAEEVERTLLLRLHKVNMSLAGLEVPRPKGSAGGAWDGGMMVGNGAY